MVNRNLMLNSCVGLDAQTLNNFRLGEIPIDLHDKEFLPILQEEPLPPLALVSFTEEEQVGKQMCIELSFVKTRLSCIKYEQRIKVEDSLTPPPLVSPEKFFHVRKQCGCTPADRARRWASSWRTQRPKYGGEEVMEGFTKEVLTTWKVLVVEGGKFIALKAGRKVMTFFPSGEIEDLKSQFEKTQKLLLVIFRSITPEEAPTRTVGQAYPGSMSSRGQRVRTGVLLVTIRTVRMMRGAGTWLVLVGTMTGGAPRAQMGLGQQGGGNNRTNSRSVVGRTRTNFSTFHLAYSDFCKEGPSVVPAMASTVSESQPAPQNLSPNQPSRTEETERPAERRPPLELPPEPCKAPLRVPKSSSMLESHSMTHISTTLTEVSAPSSTVHLSQQKPVEVAMAINNPLPYTSNILAPISRPTTVTNDTDEDEGLKHFEQEAEKMVAYLQDSGVDDDRLAAKTSEKPKPAGLPLTHEAALKWFYKDPQGEIQGPFSNLEMSDWFQAGYFTVSLLVKRGCDEVFQALGEMMKIWGRVPFTPGPAPPPLQADGDQERLKRQQELTALNLYQLQQLQYQYLLSASESLLPPVTRSLSVPDSGSVWEMQNPSSQASCTPNLQPAATSSEFLPSVARQEEERKRLKEEELARQKQEEALRLQREQEDAQRRQKEEEERKAQEEALRRLEERRREEEEKKKREEFLRKQLPSSSKWGQQSANHNHTQNALSLAEIQKLEEERERQAREETSLSNSVWGSVNTSTNWGSDSSSIWGDTHNSNMGFWDEAVKEAVQQPPQTKKGNTQKNNKGNANLRFPTFASFLKEVDSPYEVHDYIRAYLGDTPESQDFAKQFLERRAKQNANQLKQALPNQQQAKQQQQESVWGGTGSSAIYQSNHTSSSQQQRFEMVTSGKKKKKQKMVRADPSLLGFSVNASSERLNMGEIETLEDF
ncbi:hypothetical protein XENORESO_019064 [Xenotaenia resolanae]|uniref:GYF domain-containing protein n=1 Tax=Xenotaenia resolanae TaxID=208358 RepID=A0ABV0VTD3_9TELE